MIYLIASRLPAGIFDPELGGLHIGKDPEFTGGWPL
jgi:hypothetical protein